MSNGNALELDVRDFENSGAQENMADNWEKEEGMLDKPSMNIIFLLDTSGSMRNERINQLNYAMPIALEAANDAAEQNEADLFVRIIEFNSSPKWILGTAEKGVPGKDARSQWHDLKAGGTTDTAAAIELSLKCLHTEYLGIRNYHPVVILITDAKSDERTMTQSSIEKLRMALSGGLAEKKDKVWRFAIGVQNYNEPELLEFASLGTKEDEYGNEQNGVPMIFKVDDLGSLSKVLKNVTVSSLLSNAKGDDNPIVPI